MFQEIYTYSTQPYLIVWSVLFVVFAILTVISIISGFDLDLDLDGDIDVDLDGDIGGDISGGFFRDVFIFINVGHVPVTLILFTVILINWSIGLGLNTMYNVNHSIFLGICMAVGVFLVSIPLTKIATFPIKLLFKSMVEDQEALNKSVGSICETQCEVTETSGYALVKTDASPLSIMVKCEEGKTIPKISKAVVLEFDKESKRYLISEVEDDIFKK
jgi:hypothetical protein